MNCSTRQVLLVLSIGFLLLSASNSLHTQGSAPPVANQIGRLTSSGNGLRRTVYEYDELGRTTRTVNNFEGQSKAFNTGYGYPVNLTTAIGPGTVPTSQTFPDNERVDYTYDTSGAQQSIKTTPAGGSQQTIVHSIFRNSRGQTIAASYGNGAISIYKYNEATNLRLNQIQTAVGGTLSFIGGVPHLSGGTTLQNYGYSFDNNGNVIGVTDGVSTALNATYGYDSLDQLSSMTPAGQVLLPYSYDQLGNLTNKENVVQAYGGAQSCAGCAPNRGPHALASASGVTYNYDFNGNLVSTSNGTNLTSIITWNAENMPTSVVQNGSLKYQKSFVGESLWKKVEPGSITHYLPSLRIENGLARKFFGSFAERSPDGSLKFYHGDHLGSASLVTNPAGAMIRRQAYKPYGADRFIDPAGTFTPKYQFTFKEKEETTGFYDYGARLYNPFTGRWLSADTFTVDGLNRYAYVSNNPLRYVDPTGHVQKPKKDPPQFYAAERYANGAHSVVHPRDRNQESTLHNTIKGNGVSGVFKLFDQALRWWPIVGSNLNADSARENLEKGIPVDKFGNAMPDSYVGRVRFLPRLNPEGDMVLGPGTVRFNTAFGVWIGVPTAAGDHGKLWSKWNLPAVGNPRFWDSTPSSEWLNKVHQQRPLFYITNIERPVDSGDAGTRARERSLPSDWGGTGEAVRGRRTLLP